MKLLVAGYRDWATGAFVELQHVHNGHEMALVRTVSELNSALAAQQWDVVALVGWSWIVPAEQVSSNYIVAFHPSDLPAFGGGSPIQNQIIAGVKETKATLFRVTNKIDAGPVLYKQNISLQGHMDDVFRELSSASFVLLNQLISTWPDVTEHPQEGDTDTRKRLRPQDGELTSDVLEKLSCRELYDFIRCREHPYPNTFIKDKTGTLYVERVRFESA